MNTEPLLHQLTEIIQLCRQMRHSLRREDWEAFVQQMLQRDQLLNRAVKTMEPETATSEVSRAINIIRRLNNDISQRIEQQQGHLQTELQGMALGNKATEAYRNQK